MPRTPAKHRKLPTGDQLTVLQNLNQQAASWLLRRPPTWLRDHAHLFARNADGSYDARELLRAAGDEMAPAELDDRETEAVLQLAEALLCDVDTPRHMRNLRDIRERHGAAGLLAVAELLLEETERFAKHCRPPTVAELEATNTVRLQNQIQELQPPLSVCVDCGKWRQGRTWHGGACPRGVKVVFDTCPACDEASAA